MPGVQPSDDPGVRAGESMTTQPLVRKLQQFVDLSTEELATVNRLESTVVDVDRHAELIAEGEEKQQCYVILDGWAACYKQLADGRRQVINFMIPGDFLGLRSLLLQVADHSATAVTPLRLGRFSAADLRRIMAEQPRVASAILWALSRDEAIVVEHLVDVGRRNALERLAHFIIELGERLALVGLADRHGYDCPLRQEDFADALGLTAIHINRSFRQLRQRGLADLAKRRMTVHDRAGLIELAQFTDFYLAPGSLPT